MIKQTITLLLMGLMLGGCQQQLVKPSTGNEQLIELKQQAAKTYQEGDYQSALPLFQQLNEAVPNDAFLWLRTGNIHARLNQPRLAIESYEKAVRLNPELSKAWHNMAILQLRMAANSLTQMVTHTKPGDPLYARAVRLSEATLNILGKKPESMQKE